jgi:small conductance mechanosensitive channel
MRLLRLALSPAACLPLSRRTRHAQTDNGQPGGTIAVESDATQDAAIAVRIREIIGQLDGYDNVSVVVADGIVTLAAPSSMPPRSPRSPSSWPGSKAWWPSRTKSPKAPMSANASTPPSPGSKAVSRSSRRRPSPDPRGHRRGPSGRLRGFFIARRKWPWDRIAPNAFIADIYRQIVRLGFIMLGVVLALDLLNLTALLGTILGAAGIIGLAIGFAVRDTVENFIASIMLSIRQPFRPKDLVEIEGELGHVIRLTSRATILLSLDGNHIRLPNATVFKAKIINYSRNDERRFTFALGIDPGADIAKAQEIVLAALSELPFVLDTPAPGVWVEGLGASTIDLTAAAWIMQHQTSIGMAKGEAVRVVKARLEEAGIGLPEPTYRLSGGGAVRRVQARRPRPSPPSHPPPARRSAGGRRRRKGSAGDAHRGGARSPARRRSPAPRGPAGIASFCM